MDIPIYVYPIAFIVLVIIAAAVGLFIGKRKFNQEHGIVKEKKVKTPKPKSEKKLKRSEKPIPVAYSDEIETDEDYDRAVKSLKEEKVGKTQKVVEGPVIVVDENKINDEEVIEWKPPTEDKKEIKAPEPAFEETVPTPVVVSSDVKLSEDEWNDEDLEIFEARAYSFEEEKNNSTTQTSEKPEQTIEEIYAFRERKEQIYDPSDDEGVQVFETKEEKTEPKPAPKEEAKISSSKYAYFDSVMEKEKTAAPVKTEWQPPQERKTPEPTTTDSKKKPGMQYIELELDDKE